ADDRRHRFHAAAPTTVTQCLAWVLLGRAQRLDLCRLVRRHTLQRYARTPFVGCDRAAIRHRRRDSFSGAAERTEAPVSPRMARGTVVCLPVGIALRPGGSARFAA